MMKPQNVVPLDQEIREYVDTETAAYYLSLKVRSLLAWGDSGMIKPLTLPNRRKLWSVQAIRSLLHPSAGDQL